MKKLRLILCCLLLSISLAGCGGEYDEHVRYATINDREYARIETEEKGWYLFIDTETKVQYLYKRSMYQCNLACIVDADGKPILYEGEL